MTAGTSVDGAIISLGNIAYNLSTNVTVVFSGTGSGRGVVGRDVNRTAFYAGTKQGNASSQHPDASFLPAVPQYISALGSTQRFRLMNPIGFIDGPTNTAYTLDSSHWQADDGNPQYSWQTLPLINGFVPGAPCLWRIRRRQTG